MNALGILAVFSKCDYGSLETDFYQPENVAAENLFRLKLPNTLPAFKQAVEAKQLSYVSHVGNNVTTIATSS
jgi:hypothetical protein